MLPTRQTVDVKRVKEQNLTAQPWSGGSGGGTKRCYTGSSRASCRLHRRGAAVSAALKLEARLRRDHACPLPPQDGRDRGQPTAGRSKVGSIAQSHEYPRAASVECSGPWRHWPGRHSPVSSELLARCPHVKHSNGLSRPEAPSVQRRRAACAPRLIRCTPLGTISRGQRETLSCSHCARAHTRTHMHSWGV